MLGIVFAQFSLEMVISLLASHICSQYLAFWGDHTNSKNYLPVSNKLQSVWADEPFYTCIVDLH